MFGFRPAVLVAAFAAMVAIALALGLAQSAYATPTTGQFQFEETYVDDGASAACGFPVTFHQLGRGRYERSYDQQGNLTRVQVQIVIDGTATANGITLLVHGAGSNSFDVLTGTQMDASLEFRVWLPGFGVVIMDRGRLVFDAEGNVIFEAGPHPALEGDFSALCAALTP
jgi:hypothetical protein